MKTLKSDWRAACCRGNGFLYELYVFRGHAFRVYPNGSIGKADEGDMDFIKEDERRKAHA